MSASLMMTCMGFLAAAGPFAAVDFFSCAEALDPKTQRQPRTTARAVAFLMTCLPALASAGRDARLPARLKAIVARLELAGSVLLSIAIAGGSIDSTRRQE